MERGGRRDGKEGDAVPVPAAGGSEYEQAVAAHSQHYSLLLERAGPRLDGAGEPDGGVAQGLALGRLRLELGNFRRAARTALDLCQSAAAGAADPRACRWLQPLAHYLYRVFDRLGESRAASELYAHLLEGGAAERPELQLPLLVGLAQARWRLGELAQAKAAAGRALPLARCAGDAHSEAVLLSSLGTVALNEGDNPAAQKWHLQSLAVCRAAGDRRGEAISLGNLALVAGNAGRHAAARDLLNEALALRRAIGDRAGEAYSLSNLGLAEWEKGRLPAARAAQGQALAIRRELGDRRGEAYSLNHLALVAQSEGDHLATVELYAQALAIFHEVGDRRGAAYAFSNLAGAELARGREEAAGSHVSRALELFASMGDRAGLARACGLAGAVLVLRGAWAAGTILIQPSNSSPPAGAQKADPALQAALDVACARLAAAVRDGEATPAEMEGWREQGAALGLDGLAAVALAALRPAAGAEPGALAVGKLSPQAALRCNDGRVRGAQ